MNEFAKTGVFVGAAAGLALLAMAVKPGEVRLDLYDDQGQEFFAGFTDSADVAELEVTAFREASSDIYAFAVKRDDKGVWTIPSHGNYPADASDQMGKAAAMLIGLKKQKVVGDEKGRHAEYGVVDPLAEGAETAGRGKRVTMKDKAGNVLADLIVGKEVEDKPQTFYVRVPGKKRVYQTKLEGKLSTQFADWIETDLLKAQAFNISKVTFDDYSIDEQQGQIVPGDKIELTKGADNKWALAGIDAEKEETNQTKASEIGTTLSQIKIVGVRTKPEGLTARLERANGVEARILQQHLQDKGYFLGRGGKLYSFEGDLLFTTKAGVRYTLRFGKSVFGQGDELTAGIGGDEAADDNGGEDAPKPSANNRYLMVTAEFDESLLDKPEGARIAQEEVDKRREARREIEAIVRAINAYRAANDNQLPESLAALTDKSDDGDALLAELKPDPWGGDYALEPNGESFVVLSHGPDKAAGGEGADQDVRSDAFDVEDAIAKAAGAWATFDSKVKSGQEEAERLTKRFGPWYYVIDQELFAKLKPKREDLVQAKKADEDGKQPPK